MNIDINNPILSKIVLELLFNKKFKNEFQAFAPEIYADIESFTSNPNCTCKNKIEIYAIKNKEKTSTFLNNFINDNNINLDLDAITQKYTSKQYAGIVEKVKISEWDKFKDKLVKEKAIYRSFATIKFDEEYIYVFFL
jgi:hypothetical protein